MSDVPGAARDDESASGARAGAATVEPVATRSSRRRKKRPSRQRQVVDWIVLIALALVAAFLIRTFVVETYWIPSGSMETTLHGCPGCSGDRVLVSKLSYDFSSIQRGDIVVFTKPPRLVSTDKDLIKRVIGLPGDTLKIAGGKVYVDGKPQSEPYADCLPPQGGPVQPASTQPGPALGPTPMVVPKGDIFVMGDNRCNSSDSRVFGPITESSVVGVAVARVWPPSRWHWF